MGAGTEIPELGDGREATDGSPVKGLFAGYYSSEEEQPEDLRANFTRFTDRLRAEWRNGWPVVVLIDGTRTGSGKSTLGIQICRKLDEHFALDHIAFRARDLEPLYSRLPAWSMVQLDEPRDLMASKGTRDRELMHIVAALGSVRKNLIGTVMIAPKKEMYDTLVLGGLAPYWIFVEQRGVGRVHRAWTGPTYRKSQRFWGYDRNYTQRIGFRSLDRDAFFQAYNNLAVRKNREFYAERTAPRRSAGGGEQGSPSDLTGPERHRVMGVGASTSEAAGGREYVCPTCSRRMDNRHNLDAHLGACRPAKSAARK
jgi:hypothetical protein